MIKPQPYRWTLGTLVLIALAAVAGYLRLPSFAVTLALIAVIAILLTYDEWTVYLKQRAAKPKHEPPTTIPDFPAQTKRDFR